MEILASNLGEILANFWSQWLWPIILLVAGLGLVIFVHELGHFLAAKAVRIKVERFSLGFGWRIFNVKIGETDYSIGAIPLGGYIKMLGQEDFSRLDETDAPPDPRSYAAKSVGARLVVISAGVVMNVILASVLFVAICLVGKKFVAPVVGGVREGFPASQAVFVFPTTQPAAGTTQPAVATTQPAAGTTKPAAEPGLKPGDRILSIKGDGWVLNMVGMPVTRFLDIFMIAALADRDDQFLFTIEREVDGRKQIGTATLGVKQPLDRGLLAFGLASTYTTTIGTPPDVIVDTPFKDGDVVVAINGQPIHHYWDIAGVSEKLDGRPVTVTVRRKRDEQTIVEQTMVLTPQLFDSGKVFRLKDGREIRGRIQKHTLDKDKKEIYVVEADDGRQVTIRVEDRRKLQLEILGMMPGLRVATVSEGSPAHESDLRPGDIIVLYGDIRRPTYEQFRRITGKVAGQGTSITVLRGQDHDEYTCDITPKTVKNKMGEVRGIVGVVLAPDLAECVVADVRKGSAADEAGIVAGATITAVNGKAVKSWQDVYRALRDGAGKSLSIDFRHGSREATARIGKLTPEMFDPGDYQFIVFSAGVGFMPMSVRIVKKNPLAAIKWGCGETVKMVLTTYLMLRSMISGTVSVGEASGPVGIGSVAIKAARQGMLDFVYFIAFLSAAIAVFNFLPLPVLDGGHAVLLIIEKVRRKPLSPRTLNIVQMVGLALILCILAAVTFNDIYKMIRESW